MEILFLRHASLVLKINGLQLLIDPMLRAARSAEAIQNTPNPQRNPLVSLPMDEDALKTLLEKIGGVLVTHTHSDHWDDTAQAMLSKSLPIFCQPDDHQQIEDQLFTSVQPVIDEHNWKGIQFARTGGQHGKGKIGKLMAPVSGFVVDTPGEPKVYIAGDTIWCEEVETALNYHKPDVIILNAGAAQFNFGGPITMTADDVLMVCESSPNAQVVAVHMEAINHCLLSRSALEDSLIEAGLNSKVWIPNDGEQTSVEG